MPTSVASPRGQHHLVQAAGHGLLRVSDTRHDAVVKPTTENEVRMYGMLRSDPVLANLREFTPRFFGSCPRPPGAPHPKYTHEVELENLCILDHEHASEQHSDDEGSCEHSGRDPSSDNDFVGSEADHDSDDSKETSGHVHKRTTIRTQWSAPSVLDVKVGRVKHTPMHSVDRVSYMQEKDRGSTSDVHGIRICGLKHERRVVDVTANAPTIECARHISRVDAVQKSLPASANSSPTDADSDLDVGSAPSPSTLGSIQTLERQRREPCTKTPSPNSGALGPRERGDRKPSGRVPRRAVLGKRYEWTEGKSLGRRVELEGFRRAIAKFCTCIELSSEPLDGGRSPPGASATPLDFEPNPHRPLLDHYHNQLVALCEALEATDVLSHYSFTSSSLIFVHDFHVRIGVTDATASPCRSCGRTSRVSHGPNGVAFRAKLRLVDFSSSGRIAAGDVYDDNVVGFMFGLKNLIHVFEELLERYPGSPTDVLTTATLSCDEEDTAKFTAGAVAVRDWDRRASTESTDTPRIVVGQ